MPLLSLPEECRLAGSGRGRGSYCRGEVELEVRDVNRGTIRPPAEDNLIKIYAKEIIAHQLAPRNVWDPNAGTGTGAWVSSGIDVLGEFAPRYIVFGAAFGHDRSPISTVDSRYYRYDQVSGTVVPNSLGVGAEFDGGLINAVPISEPLRPLKKVERIYFEPSYQPAGVPLLQPDVRAMNNVVVLETTLYKDEYNGFDRSSSDYFTITEVALVGGRELDHTGACECDPHDLFLTGDSGHRSLLAHATGGATVTLDPSEIGYAGVISEGDQVKIVAPGTVVSPGTTGTTGQPAAFNQVSPFYLVINKSPGGSDIELDRVPVDNLNRPISGQIGVFRDGFRIFSHRILKSPQKKSIDAEIVVRWRIALG